MVVIIQLLLMERNVGREIVLAAGSLCMILLIINHYQNLWIKINNKMREFSMGKLLTILLLFTFGTGDNSYVKEVVEITPASKVEMYTALF